MKRGIRALILYPVLFLALAIAMPCFAQSDSAKRVLVLDQAKEYKKVNAQVKAYLLEGNILEVIVSTRVYAGKPEIDNLIIAGPELGRLSAQTKQTLRADLEEGPAIEVSRRGGLFGTSEKKKTKALKGVVVRELHRFKLPADKIIPGKRYELRLRVESTKLDSQFKKFDFELKDLPELIDRG